MLTANNPLAPKNIARFNMKERMYKFEPMVEQTIVHYATDGWLLHKGSEEAKRCVCFSAHGEAGRRAGRGVAWGGTWPSCWELRGPCTPRPG